MSDAALERLSPGGALEVFAAVSTPGELKDLSGRLFGVYRLTSFIAAGGMSQVYRARRDDDNFDREVAVKIATAAGLDGSYLARFLQEQRVLAGLNHPNIAQLYDVGVSDDGWPYIVMELVDGIPIDEYVETQGLGHEQILQLIEAVADALIYAHNNLVVHRDIKPSNVLVDANGTPKLLDFGIAKQLGDTASTLTQTLTPLTPRFASPEQLLNQPVSVASDVYQLGALAVSLLAGDAWGADDLETATANALNRTTPPLPDNLRGRIPKDLQVLLTTAVQADPALRYATASELAADLRNFRLGFPVNARPATIAYRMNRFVRRNLWPVGIAALALTVIISGSIWYTHSLAQSRGEAQQAARQAEAINDFLLNLFTRISPVEGGTADLTARALLDQSLADIDGLADQPDIQSGVQHAIGEVYLALGELDQAQTLLERSLATRKARASIQVDELADAMMSLGILAFDHAQFEDALRHYQEAHSLLLEAYTPDAAAMIRPLHLMGNAYIRLGNIEQAEQTIRQTLELRHQHLQGFHQEIGISYDVLGLLATWQGKLDEAEALFKQAHEQFEGANATMTVAYGGSLDNYGRMLGERGDHAASLPFHLRANEIFNELYGQDHVHLAQSNHRIAMNYQRLEDYPAAIEYAQRSIDMFRRLSEPPNFMILSPLTTLAELYHTLGRYDEAVAAGEEALRFAESGYPRGHWRIASLKTTLGGFYGGVGRNEEARTFLEQGLAGVRDSDMAGTMIEVYSLKELGEYLNQESEPAAGQALLQQALALAEHVAPQAQVTAELRRSLDAL